MEKKKINRSSREEFIKSVANEVIKGLKEEDKAYIRNNPNPSMYHFTLGMHIRNKYIHGKKLPFMVLQPDELSGEIIRLIIKNLTSSVPDTDRKGRDDRMKVRYIGPDTVAIRKDKIYEVLDEKHGTYKIMTELDETYYVPNKCFETVEEHDELWEEIQRDADVINETAKQITRD